MTFTDKDYEKPAENWWIDFNDNGVRKSVKVNSGCCTWCEPPDTKEGAQQDAELMLKFNPDADPIIYRHNP